MSAFTGDSSEREESGWPAPGLLTSPLKRVCFVLCLLRSLGPAVMPRRCWSELSERRVSDVKPCCRDCRPARAPPWGASPHVGPPHVMAASVCRGLCRRRPCEASSCTNEQEPKRVVAAAQALGALLLLTMGLS